MAQGVRSQAQKDQQRPGLRGGAIHRVYSKWLVRECVLQCVERVDMRGLETMGHYALPAFGWCDASLMGETPSQAKVSHRLQCIYLTTNEAPLNGFPVSRGTGG